MPDKVSSTFFVCLFYYDRIVCAIVILDVLRFNYASKKDISERLRTNAKKKFHLPITKVALIRSTKLRNYLINRNFWLPVS